MRFLIVVVVARARPTPPRARGRASSARRAHMARRKVKNVKKCTEDDAVTRLEPARVPHLSS
jgi:hypothetical protein